MLICNFSLNKVSCLSINAIICVEVGENEPGPISPFNILVLYAIGCVEKSSATVMTQDFYI